ncbi:hypothetical protein VVD49_08120 [Uliginosibacterium sp. H3]|uniref:Uncharacterized protein n=1 Tax=Uliginosibacterium silvisoli TaxID=3114758 RepID=A0ABU6K373_9RHOO|nr:hypothetical protein [Uliginosibacterium sp. H3]
MNQRNFLMRAMTIASIAAGLAVHLPASAADAPRILAADGVEGEAQLDAVVTNVDKTNRVLTLRERNGVVRDVQVDPSVQAFDKVKKGDQIVVNYKLAVALALRKGGKGQRELAQSEASGPLANYDTGRQVTRKTTITAAVTAYDKDKKIATLKGPKGRVVDVKVEDPAIASDLKKGDQVIAVVSETLAVALWPKAEADAARKAASK